MAINEQNPQSIALVTGASRGIGLEVAHQLAQRGMTVLLTARNVEQGQRVAEPFVQAGLDVRPYALDISDTESVRQLTAQLEHEFGRLDVLVNNAAAFVDWTENVLTADLAAAHKVLETNLIGTWRICQSCVPLLQRSVHGRIVIVSSGAGSHGDAQFGLTTNRGTVASYGISKAALNALAAKLAAALAEDRILVNAVCPGLTATAPGMEAMGARPVAEGAASVVWAATLPDDGPTGRFFRDGKPVPW